MKGKGKWKKIDTEKHKIDVRKIKYRTLKRNKQNKRSMYEEKNVMERF